MLKSAQPEEKYRGVEQFYGLRTNMEIKNFPDRAYGVTVRR